MNVLTTVSQNTEFPVSLCRTPFLPRSLASRAGPSRLHVLPDPPRQRHCPIEYYHQFVMSQATGEGHLLTWESTKFVHQPAKRTHKQSPLADSVDAIGVHRVGWVGMSCVFHVFCGFFFPPEGFRCGGKKLPLQTMKTHTRHQDSPQDGRRYHHKSQRQR